MFNQLSYLSSEQTAEFRRFIAKNKQNIELITSRLMLAMGFKLSLRGAIYLREAIVYCYRIPASFKINFSKQVYPYLANNHNTDARNVDRDMRTALKKCHENGRMLIINDICDCEIVSPNYPPTIGEFIIPLLACIRDFEMEYEAHSM